MVKIEIEKKFLLKSLPKKEPIDIIRIEQWYWKNKNGIWERARTYHSDKTGDKYIHTIKKNIGKGVNEEDEKFLTKEEFESFVLVCKTKGQESRCITKERHLYKQGKLYWEVDRFLGYDLIVAEIEIPKENYRVRIPRFLKHHLILEVTGFREFSNRNLSIPYKHPQKEKEVK